MREIGKIRDSAELQRLTDYLLTLGIRTHADEDPEHGYVLWGVEEDRIAQARAEVVEFLQNPADPKYASAAAEARALRAAQEKRDRELRKKIIPMGRQWSRGGRPTLLTWGLIAICVVIAMATSFGKPGAVVVPNEKAAVEVLNRRPPRLFVQRLTIAHYVMLPDGSAQCFRLLSPYSDIARGEVWRLITPIFLHFSMPHLVFNMLGLASLGGLLERRYGASWLLVFVIVTAIVSNVCQYALGGERPWVGSPTFGGMSGVLYAQFGFAWIRGRYDPSAGFRLSPTSVFIMLLWLVICMTGRAGPIANVAHAAGLVIGAVWGGWPVILGKRR